MRSALLLFPLLAAACAATPAERAREQAAAASEDQKLSARLAGYIAGPPTDCLINLPNRNSTAFGSKILYSEGAGGTLYVNQTTGGCENMEHGDYLVTISNSGRLCAGDIGRTFTPTVNVPTGSCALGSFTPYTRNR